MNEPYVYQPVEIDVVTAEELADIKKAALEAKTDDKPPPRIVSIDIETTGLGPHCAMTEIALYDPITGDHIHRYLQIEGRADWEAFALANTAMGRQEPEGHLVTWANSADLEISRWLADLPGAEPGQVLALGWNVGSFDRRFIRRALPMLDGWLSYRHIDLTAIRYLFDDAGVPITSADPDAEAPKDWADHAKKEAAYRLGGDNAHDALWDAKAAALFWEMASGALDWLVQTRP